MLAVNLEFEKVMKILNLDLDFFVTPIAHYKIDENKRLSKYDYKVWSKKCLQIFLEKKCNLTINKPVKGYFVAKHKEVFFLWRELIKNKVLATPFELYHIDAHDDLGCYYHDLGCSDVITKFILKPIQDRPYRNLENLNSGNYLLYSLACRWIRHLYFVRHPLDNQSIPFLSGNGTYIQLKHEEDDNCSNPPRTPEPSIEFTEVHLEQFSFYGSFDIVFISKSPGFTPETADSLIDILKQYVTVQ